MFYIKENEKIVLFDENREKLEQTLKFMPKYADLPILETTENETVVEFELMTFDEVEEREQEKKQDRINNLTMTALDLIGVLRGFGLTLEQINDYLESNLEIKMQLTYCQNVYCGVVKSLMPITIGDITITANMIEEVFKSKNNSNKKDGVVKQYDYSR